MEQPESDVEAQLKAEGLKFWGVCWTRRRPDPADAVSVWVRSIRNGTRWQVRFLRGSEGLGNFELEVSSQSRDLFTVGDAVRALDSFEGGVYRSRSREEEIFEKLGPELAQLSPRAGELIRQKGQLLPQITPCFNPASGLVELRDSVTARFRVSPENPTQDLWSQYEAGMRAKEEKILEALKEHRGNLEDMRKKFFGPALETL